RAAGSIAALRPLWAGADRVIFNGDTVETRARRHRADAARHLDELRRLTAEDGVELILIAGNHDPLICETDWVTLGGGAVVVTHGDLLHAAVAPWSDLDGERENTFDAALSARGEDRDSASLSDRADAARRASVRQWRRQQLDRFATADRNVWQRTWRRFRKVLNVLHYWRTFPGLAEEFAHEYFPSCRFFVFGHIHRPGVWLGPAGVDGRPPVAVINTGAFAFPRRPRAVVIVDGRVTFWKVRFNRRRGHRLSRSPMQ
ncbi:MAG: hypothetical protein AAGL98_07315, partial [Planctomycetota bacterium]